MKVSKVFILASCRKPDLAPMTELVFKTVRIGFPNASIQVSVNAGCEENCPNIKYVAELAKCVVVDEDTIHHRWIDDLIETQQEPFYVLDTDVIFYESFERFDFSGSAMAGYRIPEFQDEFMGAITRARLHTSLLYIDPVLVRRQFTEYESGFTKTPFRTIADPCNPLCLSLNGRRYFHDTCSVLYHAIGGTEFSNEQKESYVHFHYGTLEDMVIPRLSQDPDSVISDRRRVMDHPMLGKGGWRKQEEYYQSRQPVFDGKDVIAPIDTESGTEAVKWNIALCKGNQAAMTFCNIWYDYCHGIDDLIDTMKDGRPMMSKQQMISLFFKAAILYNCPFYMENQQLLFPIILETTNVYQMSVDWENSPRKDLRTVADVFRTCGNRLYSMVALICGGEIHMIEMSKKINERDYVLQHDQLGNPI